MDTLQFHPPRMREEAERLRALASSALDAALALEGVPARLQGQLGERSPLPGHLRDLLRRCRAGARRLDALAGALARAAEIYEGAEGALVRQAQGLPGPALTGGSGPRAVRLPSPGFPPSAGQFGGFLVDDWLARLVLEEERGGLPPFPGLDGGPERD